MVADDFKKLLEVRWNFYWFNIDRAVVAAQVFEWGPRTVYEKGLFGVVFNIIQVVGRVVEKRKWEEFSIRYKVTMICDFRVAQLGSRPSFQLDGRVSIEPGLFIFQVGLSHKSGNLLCMPCGAIQYSSESIFWSLELVCRYLF